MKKVIFSALALSMIVMFSCNKKQIEVVKQETATNETKKGYGNLRIFCDNGVTVWCEGTGGNCANDVEVPVSSYKIIDDLITVVNNSVELNIIEYFTNHQTTLETILDIDVVAGVINRSYKIEIDGNFDEIVYLQFYDNYGELFRVIPLKK